MNTSTHETQEVPIRSASSIFPDPPFGYYSYLNQSPQTLPQFSIEFRHPAYPPCDNTLFSLFAWDHADGGIHYGFAHTACSIIADNRFDGFLSRSPTNELSAKVDLPWDAILPASVSCYYFHVPHPPDFITSSTEPQLPYRWPVVLNFQDWKFPPTLPAIWSRIPLSTNIPTRPSSQSDVQSATRRRDLTCRVTASENGGEVAHILPDHELTWFKSNNMGHFNTERYVDSLYLTRSLSNSILLRSDIHTTFDRRWLIFFPKDPQGFILHTMEYMPDIGPLYHNTRVEIARCGREFLFARFAWTIFPLLIPFFLSSLGTIRTVVQISSVTQERSIQEVAISPALIRRISASRGHSTKKRSRTVSDQDEVDYCTNRQRFDSSPSTQPSDSMEEPRLPLTSPALNVDPSSIETLRENALALQRPKGFVPGFPPYDVKRPVREELEILGVEFFDLSDEEEPDHHWLA